jgi:hypothetical protein
MSHQTITTITITMQCYLQGSRVTTHQMTSYILYWPTSMSGNVVRYLSTWLLSLSLSLSHTHTRTHTHTHTHSSASCSPVSSSKTNFWSVLKRTTFLIFSCSPKQKKNHLNTKCQIYTTTGWSKSLCTWWLQYKKHATIFKTVSITYHNNVVRIRDNRWQWCESSVLLVLMVNCQAVRYVNKCLDTGGGHFEHYL